MACKIILFLILSCKIVGTICGPEDVVVTDEEPTLKSESDQFMDEDLKRNIPHHIYAKYVFTSPNLNKESEMPTNTPISMLVSLENDASSPSDIYVERIEGSIRYPQDQTFFIQNFTSKLYFSNTKFLTPSGHFDGKHFNYWSLAPSDFHRIPRGVRSVFDYTFRVSEQLSNRPFTLVIQAVFRDSNSTQYVTTAFNQTIQFTELETGLDGQTFFLYLLMAGCVVLLALFLQNFVTTWGKRKLGSSLHSTSGKSNATQNVRRNIEMGTQSNLEGVDLDWLPKETLDLINKKSSQSVSPKLTRRTPTSAKK